MHDNVGNVTVQKTIRQLQRTVLIVLYPVRHSANTLASALWVSVTLCAAYEQTMLSIEQNLKTSSKLQFKPQNAANKTEHYDQLANDKPARRLYSSLTL